MSRVANSLQKRCRESTPYGVAHARKVSNLAALGALSGADFATFPDASRGHEWLFRELTTQDTSGLYRRSSTEADGPASTILLSPKLGRRDALAARLAASAPCGDAMHRLDCIVDGEAVRLLDRRKVLEGFRELVRDRKRAVEDVGVIDVARRRRRCRTVTVSNMGPMGYGSDGRIASNRSSY